MNISKFDYIKDLPDGEILRYLLQYQRQIAPQVKISKTFLRHLIRWSRKSAPLKYQPREAMRVLDMMLGSAFYVGSTYRFDDYQLDETLFQMYGRKFLN